MKILIIVSEFPKVTETFVLSNARHFLDAGETVHLFHLKPFRKTEVVQSGAQPVIDRAFTFSWIGRDTLFGFVWSVLTRPLATLGALSRIIGAFWTDPKRLVANLAIFPKSAALARFCHHNDIDHIHAEFAGYPATAAWIVNRISGTKFSFSAHAHDIFLTQRMLSRKARNASFVRAISRFNVNYLSQIFDFPVEKIQLLRCGVLLPAKVPQQSGVETLRLLFVGALLPRKGVDHLLRAVDRLPADLDWKLDIIGAGSQYETLKEQADKISKSRITFHGPQPTAYVKKAMESANAVIVPSVEGKGGRSEGIPVVIMEALSLGKPVISSRLSGIPELIEHRVTGFLTDPGDDRNLSACIQEVWSNYDLACQYGMAGRARVEQEFDINKTAADLLAAIKAA